MAIRVCPVMLALLISVGCGEGSSGGDSTPDVSSSDVSSVSADGVGDAPPCSPEALGLVGEAVPFTTLSVDCAVVEEPGGGDERDAPAGPEVTVVTSAEDLLTLLECPDGEIDVDFTASRVVVIQGSNLFPARPAHWVVDVDGTIWVDLTFEAYSSGIELFPEPYSSLVVLPAGDASVKTQQCQIPYDGPDLPQAPE